MLVGSVPMSLVGVWLAARLTQRYGDNVKDLMGQVLGAALLFGAVGLVAKSLVRAKERRPGLKLTNRDRAAAVLTGIRRLRRRADLGRQRRLLRAHAARGLPAARAQGRGTEIFHAAVLLYVAGAAHWLAGNVDFHILGWLLLGSIPGVLIGGRLTVSISEDALRLVLATVLGLAGLKLVNVPFAGTIIVVALAAGLAGLLVYLGRHSWIRLQRARAGTLPTPAD